VPLIAVLGIAILGIAVLGIAPIGRLVVAPAPISLKLEPARLMLALGDPIGGVVGVIVTPVALLRPEVSAPAPLLEAVPSMVSPGAVVAFVDGAPLGVSVAGLIVTLGVVGVITVWARAGAGAAKLAKMGAISILFMPLSFFVAPLNRKLSLFSLVP
jgi:hypothetical protein